MVEADKLRAARRERAAQAAERRFDGVRDVRALMRGAGPSRSGRLALDVLARRADVERARVARAERIAQLNMWILTCWNLLWLSLIWTSM